MSFQPTEIPDVLIVEPRVFCDARGFFLETYNERDFVAAGVSDRFVQDNWSRSCRGTLRGLHYQLNRPQAKLVRVMRGAVYDVAVDLRRNSPTFGRWVGVHLTEDDRRAVYIPAGFAHGFCVLSEIADVVYKCSDFYQPGDERTLLWNDPALGIAWPVEGEPILSDKDRQGVPLADAEYYLS